MITISEKPTKKMPGFTSLFISFDYNTAIIEALKTVPNMMYHKSLKAWETPLSLLSEVIDKLCSIDDITINWLPDKPKKTIKDIKLSEYKTKPMSHQIDAIKYGLIHDKWLLLDEPGLGKSLDIIYLALELKKRENIQHCLVICGVNTIKTNWRREIEKHSDLSVRILGERTTKTGNRVIGSVADRLEQLKHPIDEFFVISNIETFRNSNIIDAINNGPNNFDMIVVDEVHACLDYDSLINTNIGELKIGDIVKNKINCQVSSYSTKTNSVEYKPIQNYNEFISPCLLELFILGEDGQIHTIKCTPNHKIYTLNRGYVEAKNIVESDDILIDNLK